MTLPTNDWRTMTVILPLIARWKTLPPITIWLTSDLTPMVTTSPSPKTMKVQNTWPLVTSPNKMSPLFYKKRSVKSLRKRKRNPRCKQLNSSSLPIAKKIWLVLMAVWQEAKSDDLASSTRQNVLKTVKSSVFPPLTSQKCGLNWMSLQRRLGLSHLIKTSRTCQKHLELPMRNLQLKSKALWRQVMDWALTRAAKWTNKLGSPRLRRREVSTMQTLSKCLAKTLTSSWRIRNGILSPKTR